jgi:hypothetical protein
VKGCVPFIRGVEHPTSAFADRESAFSDKPD